MKRVLMVDDREQNHAKLRPLLVGKVELVSALTIEEAERLFENGEQFDAIIMDACVPGNRPTTVPLVEMIRRGGFTGPMIAASSVWFYCKKLVEAGCDYQIENRNDLAAKIFKLLGV